MKKTLSWLIVLALLVGMMPAVFAAEGGEEGSENTILATPLVEGDNVIELPLHATEASVYSYVATATGTLYIMTTDFQYAASWTGGEYVDNNEFMSDWNAQTTFTVNGEELEGAFYGSVEVVEGETYTFSWAFKEDATYGFKATINLSYTDELIPVPGVDIELFPYNLPRSTVEIPAHDKVLYKISYDFAGYILRIYGENAYLYYEMYDWMSNEFIQIRIDAVDGVVEYDLNAHGAREFYIGNDGDEAVSFEMDYYAPLGGENNPIVVEKLEDISVSATAGEEFYVYFQWTATETGTVVVIPDMINITFYNLTSDEYGAYDNAWIEYSIYVQSGDILQVAVGGYAEGDVQYYFAYDFIPGYRQGSEQNPFEADLLAGLELDLYSETVYYTWTPSVSAIVELNFTYQYSYSSNIPTMTINGEPFNFGVIAYGGNDVVSVGEQLTVTAGEPVIFALSTVNSVYGTLVATVVEEQGGTEGDGTEENPWIIESLPYVIEGVWGPEYEYGHFYNVTVPVAGTVYVEDFYGCMVSFMVNGEWGYPEPFQVNAGDVVTIAPWGFAEGEAYMISVGFTPAEGGEGGDEEEPDLDLELGENNVIIKGGEQLSPQYIFVPEVDGMLTLDMIALQHTYMDQIYDYSSEEIAEMLASYNIGIQVDGVDYLEPVAVTAGTPVIITISQSRMYAMYGYSWKATLNLSVVESGNEPVVPENPLVLGDNALEQNITYSYVVEEDGTLVLLFSNVLWDGQGQTPAGQLGNWVDIFVNGQAISVFYNTLEVTAGDVITVLITPIDASVYTADLNISYAAEAEEIFLGDNDMESYQEYFFTAPQNGTLYLTIKNLYCEQFVADEYSLGASVNVMVNGQPLQSFRYELEVNEGDEITISVIPNNYIWFCQMYLSFEGYYEHPVGSEKNPVHLSFADCPVYTPVIPAGEEFYFSMNYDFDGAVITITGEGAYVVRRVWSNEAMSYVDDYIYSENGVLVYNFDNSSTIRIGNSGTEDVSYYIEAYLPEGHVNNPAVLEEGDTVVEIAEFSKYYFYYIPTEDGTLTVSVTGAFWAFTMTNEGLTDGWEDDQYGENLYAAWSETNTITMDVKAGEYIVVSVWTYDSVNYGQPASTLTVTMDFVPAGGEVEILMGDVNNDGVINYLDAMMVAQYYVGDIDAEGLNVNAADVNGDGNVNYLDAMMIAQFYVGDIDSFNP